MEIYGKIYTGVTEYRVEPSNFFTCRNKMGGVQMDIYQSLSILFLGGTFLIALLTYIGKK
ncbi:putative holin-like toxin [Clostridium boliviensis]|uniref:Holin-like toxin n=1 Tax=Clostridium boliviensis TaxID=318465 RepID=A0ABU4GQ00_9CLOT|nr:putative holin-like toxin [Clostridium boliviensis]MDW2799704.1 putative holin-like toxin [Clostridium boliviensis]